MDALYDLALADNGKGTLFTRPSPIHGQGVFTDRDVPAATILCRRLGLRSVLSAEDKRAIMGIGGADPAASDDDIFKNINHSCHPNAVFTDTGCLVNLVVIESNTEVTIDYALLLAGSSWTASCLCGQADCRNVIGAYPAGGINIDSAEMEDHCIGLAAQARV